MTEASHSPSEPEDWLQQRRISFDDLVWAVEDYAIFTLSPTGIILDWNKGAERLKGYTAAEAVGQHFSTFYPEDDRQSRRPDDELRIAALEGRYSEEGWRVKKGRGRFWALVTITAICNPEGKLAGFLKITRDLSERIAGGEALRQSEEAFKLLVESIAEYAIFMLDTGGRVVTWNSGAKRIKGYEPEEIVGKHFSIFYPQKRIDDGIPSKLLKRALENGSVEDQGWRIRKDGSRFWGGVRITAIKDQAGIHRGFAKLTHDLTDKRRTEHIEQASKRKDLFLATLAHELRNPLAPLLAGSEILLGDPSATTTVKKIAAMFSRQVGQMSRLIEDLVDISRITSGKIVLRKERSFLSEVLERAIEAARPEMDVKGHSFIIHPAIPGIEMECDPVRVTQAVGNLLGNAVKYTPGGGTIRLAVAVTAPSMVQISVRDNGMGIPQSAMPEIFELFERGIATETDGLGIGLALVKKIAELHGGTIQAFSEGEGKGSEFFLTLPFVGRTAAPGPISEENASRRLKVLIVDDATDSADMLRLFFESEGSETAAVYDGHSALKVANTFLPDIACLDLGLPDLNGAELGKLLKLQHPTIVLAAVSGWGTDDDRRITSEAGFHVHLVKPATPDQLRGILTIAKAVRKNASI